MTNNDNDLTYSKTTSPEPMPLEEAPSAPNPFVAEAPSSTQSNQPPLLTTFIEKVKGLNTEQWLWIVFGVSCSLTLTSALIWWIGLPATIIILIFALKSAPQNKSAEKKLWISFGISCLLSFAGILLAWGVLTWTALPAAIIILVLAVKEPYRIKGVHLKEWVEKEPENSEAHFELGGWYIDKNKWFRNKWYINKWYVNELYINKKAWDNAIESLEKAITLGHPNASDALDQCLYDILSYASCSYPKVITKFTFWRKPIMPITFPCPKPTCESHVQRKKLIAKDEKAGHTLPCPACNAQVTVPTEEVAAWIKTQTIKVGEKEERGKALIHMAAESSQEDVIAWLAKHDAESVNAKGYRGRTPMHYAAAAGKVDVMRLLKQQNAHVDAKDDEGDQPIHHAAMHDQTESLKCLVNELEANVDAKDKSGTTPLHYAAMSGKIASIKCLVEELEADVNAPNNDGATPIFLAAMADQIDSMKLLRDLGVDPRAPDNKGMRLWNIAVMRGNIEMQEWLRRIDAVPEPAPPKPVLSHFTNIFDAARQGTAEDVRRFVVERGVPVDTRDNEGYTPLFFAAIGGKIEMIRCLVEELGSDVNARENEDEDGATPIIMALIADKIESMDCLYALGADLNVTANGGMTIMEIAAMFGKTRIQAWLHDKGIR